MKATGAVGPTVTRLRALATGALVAVVVFYALAAPLLREWFGSFVVIPAYVAVALLAGAVAYRAVLVLSELVDRTDEEDALDGDVRSEDLGDVVGDGDLDEADVQQLAEEADLDAAAVEAMLDDAEVEREGGGGERADRDRESGR